MDSNYHKVYEVVNINKPSTSKDKEKNDIVHNIEDILLKKTNNISKDDKVGVDKTKIEIETIETIDEIRNENKATQQQLIEPPVNKKNILEKNEKKKVFQETSFTNVNSVALSEPTITQNNIPTFLNNTELSSFPSDQNKIKRSISKGIIKTHIRFLEILKISERITQNYKFVTF